MKRRSVLPGFRLSLIVTVSYVFLLVVIPLVGLFAKTFTLSFRQFWSIVLEPRALATYELSLGASLIAAVINAAVGLLLAWVLSRYTLPAHRLIDALIDLPFALPTAVAGLTLAAIYAPNGWLGRPLHFLGVPLVFSRTGVVIALVFIGLPFVVRTVQPVLEDIDPSIEEAAMVLGASPFRTFRSILLPQIFPALLTGFTLAFARAIGEYGSIIFISGNMPMKTEITPLLIVTKLEQYDYAGATTLAVVLLGMSFGLLLIINVLQQRTARRSSSTRR
jgi:sulfate transport system permease protein